MPDLASILEHESRTVEPPDGFDRLVRRRDRKRRNRRIGAAVLALVVAVLAIGGLVRAFRGLERHMPAQTPPIGSAFACPPGSTPDQPGPVDQARPQAGRYSGSMAFDRGTGRMILLTKGRVWTFDVCTNTWEALPGSAGSGLEKVVYDVDSDLTIALGVDNPPWAYDLDRGTWTRMGLATGVRALHGFYGIPQAVYDPVTGLVVVRDPLTSLMWTYDVDTDTWVEIDQGDTLPPTFNTGGWVAYGLLSYDASVDRLVLYLGDTGSSRSNTWEFDPRAHRWTEQDTHPPRIWVGYFASGNEMAYDEANGVSFLFSGGNAAAYDASAKEWQVLFRGDRRDPMSRMHFAMAYDSVNERLVVFGGSDAVDDDVWAFDLATGEWIQLLAPSLS